MEEEFKCLVCGVVLHEEDNILGLYCDPECADRAHGYEEDE